MVNEWSIVKHKHSRKICKSTAGSSDNIDNIRLMNKYEILSEHSDSNMVQEKIPVIVGGRIVKVNPIHESQLGDRDLRSGQHIKVTRNYGDVKPSANKKKHKKEHKVVLLDDSHVKGLATRLNDILKTNFEVTGYAKPNTKVKTLINPVPAYVSKLTNKDVIIFMGGSNDIDDNCIERSLSDTQQFVTKIGHTNIIMGEIPKRYDTNEFSTVNQKIRTYNRILKKYGKSNTHLSIMETMQERKYYTNHGFHLNALGKDELCLKLRVIIDRIFMSNTVLPISLKWEKDHSENTLNAASEVQVKKLQEEEESVNLHEIIVINEMQVKESQVQEEEHGTISEIEDPVINRLKVKELQGKRSSCRIKKTIS
jgi:hypothetical protein